MNDVYVLNICNDDCIFYRLLWTASQNKSRMYLLSCRPLIDQPASLSKHCHKIFSEILGIIWSNAVADIVKQQSANKIRIRSGLSAVVHFWPKRGTLNQPSPTYLFKAVRILEPKKWFRLHFIMLWWDVCHSACTYSMWVCVWVCYVTLYWYVGGSLVQGSGSLALFHLRTQTQTWKLHRVFRLFCGTWSTWMKLQFQLSNIWSRSRNMQIFLDMKQQQQNKSKTQSEAKQKLEVSSKLSAQCVLQTRRAPTGTLCPVISSCL